MFPVQWRSPSSARREQTRDWLAGRSIAQLMYPGQRLAKRPRFGVSMRRSPRRTRVKSDAGLDNTHGSPAMLDTNP